MRIESTAAVLLEGGVGEGDAAVVIPGPGTTALRPADDVRPAEPDRSPGRAYPGTWIASANWP